jgi:hypothetical protein
MHWVEQITNDYGITVHELEKRTGIDHSFFYHCKRRGTKISDIKSGHALKLANEFNMTVQELLYKYGD